MERIREAVRASPVITADETGARVAGDNRTHWVFQTPTASDHLVAKTKGAAVIAEFLGDQRPEVWGSDCAPAQLGSPATQQQLCLAHQIRELTDADGADGQVGARWARNPRHVFGRAIRLHRERARLAPATVARRRTLVVNAAKRLVFRAWAGAGEAGTLHRRSVKRWGERFVFLEREGIEPTNTSSERDLRPVVLQRKVSGGYRPEAAAERGGLVATVLTTARKTGRNRFETLCHITGPSPLVPTHQGT